MGPFFLFLILPFAFGGWMKALGSIFSSTILLKIAGLLFCAFASWIIVMLEDGVRVRYENPDTLFVYFPGEITNYKEGVDFDAGPEGQLIEYHTYEVSLRDSSGYARDFYVRSLQDFSSGNKLGKGDAVLLYTLAGGNTRTSMYQIVQQFLASEPLSDEVKLKILKALAPTGYYWSFIWIGLFA
ncbi:MAG: hypothetical protein LBK12_02070, partial [Odoribacteraceae bacterium]|nr:hypothetical protein [Odoribacteraceae bacterium]